MTDTIRPWDSWRGVIHSSRGGWRVNRGVTVCGHSLFDDILGKETYFQLLLLSVTGRLPERRLADWLEGIFTCLSWPDPRLWCNQVGALAGTGKVMPIAAVAAGVLASDSKVYGPGVALDTARFVCEAARKRREGQSVDEIVSPYLKGKGRRPSIPGYSRPLLKGVDERVVHMNRVAEDLGFQTGWHLEVCYEISDFLYDKYEEGINLAGYIVAFLIDAGLTPTEIHRVTAMAVMAGVHACYADTADRPALSFLPLRCDDIDYQGEPERPVPDAE